MSSSDEDEVTMKTARADVIKEVANIIKTTGIENLKSKAVRRQLTEKFNEDFNHFKKDIDEIIRNEIENLDKMESNGEKDKGSSSDDDDLTVFTDTKKKGTRTKRKEASTESFEDEDLMSTVKKRRRAATKQFATRSAPKKASGDKKPIKRGSYYRGFLKLFKTSEELQDLTGKKFAMRHEIVKSFYNYINEHNLKDMKDKRYGVADDRLFAILKKKKFLLFGMMKMIQPHLLDPKELGPEVEAEAEVEIDRRIKEDHERYAAAQAEKGEKQDQGDAGEDNNDEDQEEDGEEEQSD